MRTTPMPLLLHFAAAFSLTASPLAAQDVIISEFMADNVTELADVDGQFADWIEVENPGALPLNLENWSLTDDPLVPGKWRFPAVVLPGGGRLVVFASSKNRRDPTKQLHTNFALESNGGYLAIVRPDGSLRPSEWNPYPPQREDISFGVAQDVVSQPLLNTSVGGAFVPTSGQAPPQAWNQPGFIPDASWNPTSFPPGIGFDTTAPAPPPSNLARSGIAVQSTTQAAFNANLANDGLLNNFSHTATADAAPFWNVDLGSGAMVSSITVRNRGDNCCGSRLRDITIEVLDDALNPVFTSALLPGRPSLALCGPRCINRRYHTRPPCAHITESRPGSLRNSRPGRHQRAECPLNG